MRVLFLLGALALGLPACADPTPAAGGRDGGGADTGVGSPDADLDAASPADAGAPDAETSDTGTADSDTGTADASDAGASLCAITRAYVSACGGDLTCGATGFDAWCEANDQAINSEAYRRAEAQCLPGGSCDATRRRDCEYRSYAGATPSAEQLGLALDYCRTCEPADPAACARRVATYDVQGGPAAVTDVFIAVWELGDPLTAEIRARCTGPALDGGIARDAGCASLFASCAGGLYVDRLPNCP